MAAQRGRRSQLPSSAWDRRRPARGPMSLRLRRPCQEHLACNGRGAIAGTRVRGVVAGDHVEGGACNRQSWGGTHGVSCAWGGVTFGGGGLGPGELLEARGKAARHAARQAGELPQ